MDIEEKQANWAVERPLFEAEFIHSHLLPFFNFNENTGDYEIKSECVSNTDDEDRKVAYEALNTGWVMWLRAKRTSKAVPEGFALEQHKVAKKIELIIRDVAELPDRTSPEDWPEALIVTSVELEEILTQHLSEKCRN